MANLSGAFVGAGHAPPAERTEHPQPHQKTNQLCYPCRGRPMCRPAATCYFRPRAHTQVRPYKVTKQYGISNMSGTFVGSRLASTADHASEPGGPLPTGGLITQEQTPEYPSAKRSGVQGLSPCRSRKRAEAPAGGPRRSYLQPQTPPRTPAKRSGVQGHRPCRSHKRAGAPAGGPRRSDLQPQTPSRPPRSGMAAGTARPGCRGTAPACLPLLFHNCILFLNGI